MLKTLTICGSMRFEKEMQKIAYRLETEYGCNTLQCVYPIEGEELAAEHEEALKEAHYQKIDMSDGIYVVDIQGYIGSSVREEMEYAKEKGKEIILHSEYEL